MQVLLENPNTNQAETINPKELSSIIDIKKIKKY